MIAVAATSTIPQLGFIHEDSSNAFCLDIADLYRESVCLPAAFRAVKQFETDPKEPLERHARRAAARSLRDKQVIPSMIDRIKSLFGGSGGSAQAGVPASDRDVPEAGPSVRIEPDSREA
jgi:CRISPR-associated protein Cas1